MAATGAMRLEGISTPVPSLMRVVFIAAAAMATNGSALSICVSKNHAWEKPSSSARRTRRQESGGGWDGDTELHGFLSDVAVIARSDATRQSPLLEALSPHRMGIASSLRSSQ